jgi:hypothetical protein
LENPTSPVGNPLATKKSPPESLAQNPSTAGRGAGLRDQQAADLRGAARHGGHGVDIVGSGRPGIDAEIDQLLDVLAGSYRRRRR